MAVPLSTAQTIDINVARASLQEAGQDAGAGHETRYRLLSALQTTLDAERLLTIFFNEVSTLITISGLRYENESLNLQASLGNTAAHSSSYRLIIQGDQLGELTITRETRFSESELHLFEKLLGNLLCPLRNALIYQAALNASRTDALTGAGNRMALMEALEREISLARRYNQDLALLIMDVDKFKSINDEHGHAAGDRVLKELVRLIGQINRNTDQCFRYGGEEFVVLLSNTSRGGASVIGERLRSAIANMRICAENGPLQLTVSIGSASFCETDTAESLLNRADKAMYQIKQGGGNAIECV
ncbi:GGDEF domain-containing protein [Pseudohongiella spirulinae]|uniref:diguanylate cyclase n=1 Tax=Pseudohongiella spirulinae TaxID=1249552 RepID=A0A0S2KDN8_9GAMM|nr:GGDEF domain-containing protein [Pseudohongiella spirulinae]ALO46293.1 Diguanylate cyclase [Pseudohongiella spirulinae]